MRASGVDDASIRAVLFSLVGAGFKPAPTAAPVLLGARVG
jgi:hypothetical protein